MSQMLRGLVRQECNDQWSVRLRPYEALVTAANNLTLGVQYTGYIHYT